MPLITSATVRVMRSFDYCHFEVTLTGTPDIEGRVISGGEKFLCPEDIDGLRKHAMRLADKAVEQYKVAKKAYASKINATGQLAPWFMNDVKEAEATPEEQRTPEQQAALKLHKDLIFQANRSYDYQDDWDDEGGYDAEG